MGSDTRTLRIEGFEELMKMLGSMKDLNDRFYWPIHDALNQAGQMVERTAKENLTANNSVAFGHLRASIGSQVIIDANRITVEIGTNLGQMRGDKVGYGPAVESGTEPHLVPLDDLYRWVRVKRMAGRYSIKTQRRLGGKAKQLQEDMDLAWQIQQKIKRFGTRAKPYLIPALESRKEEIIDMVDKAVDRLLKEFARK